MKLDIRKQTSNAIVTQLTIRDATPESYQVMRELLENFESSLIRIKQGEKRKRRHPKSDFQLSRATFCQRQLSKQTSFKMLYEFSA